MEENLQNNKNELNLKARKSRKSRRSYKPSQLLGKLNDAINVNAIIESPEQSVHDDPDLTKFIEITDLVEAKKGVNLNVQQDLIKALKESDELKNIKRSASNQEPKAQNVKLEVRRANSSNKELEKKEPIINRQISNTKNPSENKQEVKRVNSDIKRSDSGNNKLPPKIPVPRLYANQPQKMESAVLIEMPKPSVELNIEKTQDYKLFVRKIKKMLIIFGVCMVLLVIVGVVLSVVLSVVINNSCIVKKCDQNSTKENKLLPSSITSESFISTSTTSQTSSQRVQSTTTTTTTTVTSEIKLPILRKNCEYGFTGINCEDECGVLFVESNVKIVGGREAVPHSWPSTALIYFSYRISETIGISYICGGSLIDRYTILTAAHCIIKTVNLQNREIKVVPNEYYPTFESMYKVYLGVHDRTVINFVQNIQPAVEVKVKKIIPHENFDDKYDLNDIALLKLETYVELNELIQLACLPRSSEKYPSVVNIPAWAMGWGSTSSSGTTVSKLRNVKLTVYDEQLCLNVVVSYTKNWTSQICAGEYFGGKDTCQGDSGGGLYVLDVVNNKTKYIAAGIVSYGEGCGVVYRPGIYTRISYYLDWIKKYSG